MRQQSYFDEIDHAYKTLSGAPLEARILSLLESAQAEYGSDSGLYAAMLNEVGAFYRGQHRYPEAEQVFQQALELLVRTGRHLTADYATTLNNLAGTHRLMGRTEDAEMEFQHCLELYRETVGESHILYASGLNNLSLAALDRGDHARAADLLRQASEILRRLPNCLDERATSLVNLASLHRTMGEPAAAAEALTEALELYETKLGTHTPHYHAALNAMGLVCCDMGDCGQALQWLEKAAGAAGRLYGEEHPETAAIRHHLTMVQRATGETS